MNELNVNQIPQTETIDSLKLHNTKPKKTAADWVRDMRMSAAVNKATTGVETEQVTPELLLATSKKLLGISKREQEPDPKDSLAFQRFYGPEMLFSERIQRDGGKLARNILWKATNKGNLDFMPVNALDKHISSVFYDSKLAQMMDGSSPLETIDAAYKTTRLGEGGVSSMESAPDEMRTVQPSYFGFIDPVRCYAEDTELMTETGWKKVQDITGEDKLACLINGRLEYHKPTALSVYDYDGLMYGYDDGHIAYLVTPNHRMYVKRKYTTKDYPVKKYITESAEDINGCDRIVNTGMHLPILRNEDETVFHLPPVTPDLKTPQVYGMPPQGASLKNVDEVDIVDFAEYMGWYLSEGSCYINDKRRNYVATITQDPYINRDNYIRIKNLIERLPFNATCPEPEVGKKSLTIARKQLVVYLKQFGKCEDKFIPEWLFNAPLKARLAFREAMLLGDGRAQRHLCTKSKRLAEDFARLQFELGESVKILHEKEDRYPNHPGIWVVYWHSRREMGLQKKTKRHNTVPYFTQKYTNKVYCPTVPGGLVYCRKSESYQGFWNHQSPESQKVGLDVYMTKNVMKGTDGKLYQKFIDAKTGKEVLLDSETAANSIVASNEMMDAKTKAVFALGGKTGIRIVPKDSVQYYLPRADEAYSAASNLVTMLSGVKEMRLQMGCLHPDTHVLTIDKHNLISIKKAQVTKDGSIPGSTKEGASKVFPIRTTVAKFPPKRNWFYKIVLRSGRSLITSADHRWSVLRNGKYSLIQAKDLKPGDAALRTTFKDVISRRTFVNGMLVNKDLATVLGYIARTLAEPDNIKMRFSIPEERYRFVMQQLSRIGYTEGFNTYYMNQATFCIGIRDEGFKQFLRDSFGALDRDRHIPDFIMSANAAVVGAFLDGYTTDPTKVGRDSADDIWVLDIPNTLMRDSLAFLFARIETDTLYRDTLVDGNMYIAMKLAPMEPAYGDMLLDEIKVIKKGISAPIMVDIDIDDNLYAVANGVVTHNSKYPLQAISISSREAPLVRGLDEATGKDMHTLIGKYLGARFAPRDGVVTAVRKDRIDVLYDDGTKGSIGMYINFPMNAKGYITNTPRVKAGQAFKEGDCLASSNYTDDKGVAALGTNLRSAWMSWKGGTYEDAIVISESAAKKLTSTTMYKTAVDLDKTVKLGKQNYITWKPGEFTKEQMDNLDANGIVKPGTVLHKEDPMILAVRMTEPSPGTLGKRILTDMSERWEHDHPGVVTDVVKTRNGIKVYATVTAPAEVGDKVSGGFGNKGVLSQIIPDDEMPTDSKGRPFEILLSPLGLISRTNPSQLFEAQLGKVAAKTGKPVVVPQFFKGSITEFVEDQLKQNHLKADEDLHDPVTGRVMPDVVTGVSYIYKLKHLGESKLSARGTSNYDADQVPAGKGMDGCFPGSQQVLVKGLPKSINTLAFSLNTYQVATCTLEGEPCYYPAIDSFRKLVKPTELLTITPKWSFTPHGMLMKEPVAITPTKNHAIYMYDMTMKPAGELKVGDMLAGIGLRPSGDMRQVLANLLTSPGMVEDDTLVVEYKEGHEKLAAFKCRTLAKLGVRLDKEARTITVPMYTMYQALLKDSDFGDLAVCLHQLDSEAGCTDEKLIGFIAKFIPSYIIPESMATLKATIHRKQRRHKPEELDTKMTSGLMPIMVAAIGPYITDKEQLKVYDLTIDTTHRYVLYGGFLVSNSKRFGTLEQSAMAGHGAFEIIKDSKYIRGQSNSDFWRSLRTGDIPTMPGEPLVHKKFFAHLTGAGIRVKKTPQGVSIFALTNKDVNELANTRELRSRDTYEARNFRPIDGGLFGQDIFGMDGTKWGYIQLDEPVPNPVMEEPLARLLGIPEKKFADVAAGRETVNGISGGESMKKALEKIDLGAESVKALSNFKSMSPSGKDKALKRYIAIERMRRAGVNPAEYMLDRIPVIPPVYRPITSHNGLTMVADSNYLYAQLMDARDDAREAKGLPKEFQQQARENIYTKWKELTGLYAPQDVKLQSKHVQGLLKWALGDSPKFSAMHRKLISATVDTVGRGVITPDPRLKLNEVGLPENMAFNIMAPMVQRKLVKMGYTPLQAMEKVKKRDVQARAALNEVMQDHPVLMNRAPTLHKLGIMAFNPKLVTGASIKVNPSIMVPYNMDVDGDANINRICILITREFLDFAKNIEENSKGDLTYYKWMLHYMYSQIKQPLAESSTYMAFHDTKTLIRAIEESGLRQVAMEIDLEDMPHGALTSKNSGEKHNIDFYEAVPGIKVLAYDENTGKLVWADVAYWSEHKNLPVEIVHLAGGRDIITDDDPRAVYGIAKDATTLVPQRFTPTAAKEHDVVVPCMKPGTDWVTPDVCINYVREADGATSEKAFTDRCYKLDFEFGQLLGILAGDGWWDKRDYQLQETFGGARAIRVSDNEGYTAEYTLNVLNNLFDGVSKYSHAFTKEQDPTRYGDTVRYSYHHHGFVTFNELLTQLLGGVGDEKTTGSGNKHLPVWFKATPSEFRRGLLCGLIATDGSISVSHSKAKEQLQVSFSSTSLRLCRELRDLCWSLGISSSITFSKITTRGNASWQMSISTYDLKLHDSIFDGLCHERKLQTYLNTEVSTDVTFSRFDYRPFPEYVSDVVFKWFKSPNIEKSLRADKSNPEYLERLRVSNMYAAVARYRHKGYITKYGVEMIDAYVQDCIARRIWAIHAVDETMAKLEADVHCELDMAWRDLMWKALHILKDQLPAKIYSTAKIMVTRRAALGKGCQSLFDAIIDVRTQGLETSEFGLGIEPVYQEWYKLCTESDCVWLPIESIEKTGQVETGYDLTVPGYETFVASNGVVLSNTVNIHAPVSDAARKEAYNKMMPERNLIGMRSREILYKPEKEYQQGLYIATRMKTGADVRTHYFNTLEEAKQAYRDGLIDVDDPIEIKHK